MAEAARPAELSLRARCRTPGKHSRLEPGRNSRDDARGPAGTALSGDGKHAGGRDGAAATLTAHPVARRNAADGGIAAAENVGLALGGGRADAAARPARAVHLDRGQDRNRAVVATAARRRCARSRPEWRPASRRRSERGGARCSCVQRDAAADRRSPGRAHPHRRGDLARPANADHADAAARRPARRRRAAAQAAPRPA